MQREPREPNMPVSESAPIRVPRWAFPAVTVASILIGIAAVVRGTSAIKTAADSDLTTFFFPAAQKILQGDPFHIYAVNVAGYPNYNPPLSIFLMAPLLKLADLFGFGQGLGAPITFVTLPFIALVPLLGYLVTRVLRQLYPQIPDIQLLLAYTLIVLSPLTWQSIATWYHVEQPLMLCFLIGSVLLLQARREGLAGVLAGLAVLSRTTALMPLIALGVLLLVAREWRSLAKFAGVGAAVVLVVMAPFFLAYPTETKYSLLSWRGTAQIGGNTIWALFGYTGDNHILHLVDAVARRLDMYTVVLFIAGVAFLAARRLRVSAFGAEAWAVLAVAFLAVPMLSKTNWPYYYLEPFVLLLVWEFATMHDRLPGVWRWPVLAFSFLAVTATLSQYVGLKSVGYGDRVVVGITSSGAMLAFVFAIWARMRAKKLAAHPAAEASRASASWQGAPLAPASVSFARNGPARVAPAIGNTGRVPAPNPTNPPNFAPPASPRSVPAPLSPAPNEPRAPLWPPASSDPRRQTPPQNGQGMWSPAPAAPPSPGASAGSSQSWSDQWPGHNAPDSPWNPRP